MNRGAHMPMRITVTGWSTGSLPGCRSWVTWMTSPTMPPSQRRIYAAGGEGAISVVEQVDPDHYRPIDRIPTAQGARTALFVPELSRLYVAVPPRGSQAAEISGYAVSR